MALFAKDKEETISAWDALLGKRYACLECNTPLLLRHSKKKFPHFYHLSSNRSCRLYSKSERHLLIQLEIQKKATPSVLEKPFPSIQRIADVVWEEKKIIFEVQCSFITEKEVRARVEEYASLGYFVVWVLDDARFNRRKVGAAENWMRQHSCYFVDKYLTFYDQQEIILHQKRIQRGRKLPIRFNPIQSNGKYYFENDASDLTQRLKMIPLRARKLNLRELFQKYVKTPYSSFLNSLLKIDSGR